MKETNHDYQNCLMGNYYDSNMTGVHSSWEEFKNTWQGFQQNGYDDTYHYIFRYDIHLRRETCYELELCCMLQRKGIYVHIHVMNITQKQLDGEVKEWLLKRKEYINKLWGFQETERVKK